MDREGWQEKQKEKDKEKERREEPQVPEGSAAGSSQQEAEETLTREAEDSLGEKEPSVPEGRKVGRSNNLQNLQLGE